MNPFDIKTALLAKHAQHVVLIHFPIALFLAAVIFDFAASLTRKTALTTVAYYNFMSAALTSVPVVATGILAWRWQLEGQPLKGVLLLHFVLGLVSTALMWVVWWVHRRTAHGPEDPIRAYRLAVEVLAAITVSLTAHLGGFLSGVNIPS